MGNLSRRANLSPCAPAHIAAVRYGEAVSALLGPDKQFRSFCVSACCHKRLRLPSFLLMKQRVSFPQRLKCKGNQRVLTSREADYLWMSVGSSRRFRPGCVLKWQVGVSSIGTRLLRDGSLTQIARSRFIRRSI